MRILATLALTAALASAQNYVQDVFPIWEKHCLGCHASGTTMGSLDLETWEGLQRGGNHGTIVVPGNLKASRLYTMLTGETKPAMPMDGKVLSAGEIEVVRKWIASGAPPPSDAEIAELRRRAAGEEKPKANRQIKPVGSRGLAQRREIAVGRFDRSDALLHQPRTKSRTGGSSMKTTSLPVGRAPWPALVDKKTLAAPHGEYSTRRGRVMTEPPLASQPRT